MKRKNERLNERTNSEWRISVYPISCQYFYWLLFQFSLWHQQCLMSIFYIFSGCRARVDLAFIIDGSGSIEQYGRGNFRRCLNFVKAIVSKFSINNGQTRIGVVLFSSRPRLIFGFRRYRRKSQLLNAISRIRYPRGGTKTGYAMRYCYSRVFRYARRGVRKVILLPLLRSTINGVFRSENVRRTRERNFCLPQRLQLINPVSQSKLEPKRGKTSASDSRLVLGLLMTDGIKKWRVF